MSDVSPIVVSHLVGLQMKAVKNWHAQPVQNDGCGFESLVLANHEINFRLWHEEDQARDPEATDTVIAQVKRRIDRLNQQRSDSIECLDNAIREMLEEHLETIDLSQPMNTETPGSAFDRLSILTLRVFHLDEQARRLDIDDALRNRVTVSLQIAEQQRLNLSVSLQQLMDDLLAGRKRHCTFHHLKMYNDPELNPKIYEQKGRGLAP
jgi:hypothetical protein